MVKRFLFTIFFLLQIPFLVLMVAFVPKRRKELIWGPDPIINNKYWSEAMRSVGYSSKTLMSSVYKINKREDFDLYFDDVTPKWIRPLLFRKGMSLFFAFSYMIRNACVVHLPFSGGPFGNTLLWRLEAYLFHCVGIKIIILPYGRDAYCYSQTIDPSFRNALLINYGESARREPQIRRRIEFWTRNADAMLTGFIVDGMGRWDVPVNNMICIDTSLWKSKSVYSSNNGENGNVRVLHTPNHRGAKGTEFLIHAIEKLRAEGLKVELVLLENVPNDKIREMMQEVDILADQFIATAYALSAIEGMVSGLPVMSNLEHEAYTRIFRRYAFLDECPILSTTPETLEYNLRTLITKPRLREQLGRAGRLYVEKYHSFEMAQYLFGSIYKKILFGQEVDLMNLFHPLKSEYNCSKPMVQHPLIENRLPISEGEKC